MHYYLLLHYDLIFLQKKIDLNLIFISIDDTPLPVKQNFIVIPSRSRRTRGLRPNGLAQRFRLIREVGQVRHDLAAAGNGLVTSSIFDWWPRQQCFFTIQG